MRKGSSESDTGSDDNEKKSGFSFPPIRLPPITIPRVTFARIPFSLPYPRRPRGTGSYVLAGFAIDSLDIIVTIAGYHEVTRSIVGTVLSVIVFGPIGLLYAWEAIPLVFNYPLLTLVPTALLLALIFRQAGGEGK